MRSKILLFSLIASLWCFADSHAYPGGNRPPAHRPGASSGKPALDPSGGTGGKNPSDPAALPGGSSKPGAELPSGAGAAAPIKAIGGTSSKVKAQLDVIMDRFIDNGGEQSPQEVWSTTIQDPQSGIPAECLPELKWQAGTNAYLMEQKLKKVLTEIANKKYIADLKIYLEQNQKYITGTFTTANQSQYYMMPVKEGQRIIRLKTADGSASMTSAYIFLSPADYERYKEAIKDLRRSPTTSKEFKFLVAGSFTPVVGYTLIEWSMRDNPNAQAPVSFDPVPGSPGTHLITVPLIDNLDVHQSHPVIDVPK